MSAEQTLPTNQVDAIERVLAESFENPTRNTMGYADGYYRSVAEAILETLDGPRQSALDSLYAIMMMDAGPASERAAEAYHDISGLTTLVVQPEDFALTPRAETDRRVGRVLRLDDEIAGLQAADRSRR